MPTITKSRKVVQISYEAWLIGRNEDVSKKIFVATGILVFHFELLIGGLCQIIRADNSFKLPAV